MPSMTSYTRDYEAWKCPHCESTSTGTRCRVCGRPKPEPRARRKARLVPEDKILHQAHKAAVLRVGETIPFFIAVWLVSWVLSFLIGWVCGLAFSLAGILIAEAVYRIFLGNLFEYGENVAGLRLYRDEELTVGTLFEGMHDYGRIMAGMFWIKLRIGLWMLVPVFGYIKRYSYMLAPYVLYDNPKMSAEDALKTSAELTRGHKMELFVRGLKFLGWDVLNLLSFKLVGLMYYFALYDTVWAGFYDELAGGSSEVDFISHTDRRPEPNPNPRPEPNPNPKIDPNRNPNPNNGFGPPPEL